jgi:hypothetical protein
MTEFVSLFPFWTFFSGDFISWLTRTFCVTLPHHAESKTFPDSGDPVVCRVLITKGQIEPVSMLLCENHEITLKDFETMMHLCGPDCSSRIRQVQESMRTISGIWLNGAKQEFDEDRLLSCNNTVSAINNQTNKITKWNPFPNKWEISLTSMLFLVLIFERKIAELLWRRWIDEAIETCKCIPLDFLQFPSCFKCKWPKWMIMRKGRIA